MRTLGDQQAMDSVLPMDNSNLVMGSSSPATANNNRDTASHPATISPQVTVSSSQDMASSNPVTVSSGGRAMAGSRGRGHPTGKTRSRMRDAATSCLPDGKHRAGQGVIHSITVCLSPLGYYAILRGAIA